LFQREKESGTHEKREKEKGRKKMEDEETTL